MFDPDNINNLTDLVAKVTGEGVHFMMADGVSALYFFLIFTLSVLLVAKK